MTTLLFAIALSMMVSSTNGATLSASEYTMNGQVISVLEGERQLIETTDGNVWEVTEEDIFVTDSVVVTFSDNGTKGITDDEIIKVEKVD
jgi:hypothetical protein